MQTDTTRISQTHFWLQRRVQKPVEHIKWSFFAEIVRGYKLHRRCLSSFWICFWTRSSQLTDWLNRNSQLANCCICIPNVGRMLEWLTYLNSVRTLFWFYFSYFEQIINIHSIQLGTEWLSFNNYFSRESNKCFFKWFYYKSNPPSPPPPQIYFDITYYFWLSIFFSLRATS